MRSSTSHSASMSHQRLGHDEIRTGFEFLLEAAQFPGKIFGARIQRTPDGKARRFADTVSGGVKAFVHAADDADESDGIHVVHVGGVLVIAHAGRVAGQCQDISNAQAVRTEKVALKAHQVAVTARKVHYCLDAGPRLNQRRHGETAIPRAPSENRHVDGIDARSRKNSAPRRTFVGLKPFGGSNSTDTTNLPAFNLASSSVRAGSGTPRGRDRNGRRSTEILRTDRASARRFRPREGRRERPRPSP